MILRWKRIEMIILFTSFRVPHAYRFQIPSGFFFSDDTIFGNRCLHQAPIFFNLNYEGFVITYEAPRDME